MNTLLKLLLVIVGMALAGCSSVTSHFSGPVVQESTVLHAQGYSQLQKLSYLTEKQNQYAIERVAKIKAYRMLAKQLYQQSLTSDLLVADQVIKAESFRIYLDLYLRQAKVVKSTVIRDRKIVTLQLALTPRFYHCFSTSTAKVRQCLDEDDKVPFTRIGYQTAATSTVNINCSDCSSQLSVSGFSAEKHILDKGLLELGMYDSSWLANTAASAFFQNWFLTKYVFY